VDLSDVTASGEGDGDGAWGDVFGKFRDGEYVVGIQGKEGRLNFSAERLNGESNGLEAVLRILYDAGPGVVGEANLVAEERHGRSFRKGGRKGFCNYALEGCLLSSKN